MLRIATRASPLARWQAGWVAAGLRAAWPGLEVSLVAVDTAGDRRVDVPVWAMGGQGVFVKEVQAAVLAGRAEVAVHSAKDLPSTATPGLDLCAVPERADPRDALVGGRLADLPAGAVVATGSVRRRAQLAWLRPDLAFTDVRGNIGTRLEKVPTGGALVVAAAALARLGVRPDAEALSPGTMLPQVGQGALALECRSDDPATASRLAALDHRSSHRAVRAERAFLACLGSGCALPVAAHATPAGAALGLCGLVASIDGRVLLRASNSGPADDPEAVGTVLAGQLLDDAGGRALLDVGGAATA